MATGKNDLKAELEAYFSQMERDSAPGWRPEPGTTMRAAVIGMAMRTDGPYGKYPVITYRNLDTGSTVAVHAFHQILRERLAELKTDIGSEQYITYIGKRDHNTEKDAETGKPKQYHMYHAANVADIGNETTTGKAADFEF